MSRRIALMLGVLLIAGGLLGASFTWSTIGEAKAHDRPFAQEDTDNSGNTNDGQRSQAHEAMRAMMGEGFTERMHAAMPGSEAMMEACANGMGDMMDGMQMDMMMGER